MPPAEVDIDARLIRRLLDTQASHLADRPVRVVANGWDNVIARLGDDLCVRLPRRAAAAQLVLNEQRCLPLLAPALPLATPVPLFAGQPDDTFAWHWSVCPWFPGDTAAATPPQPAADAATALAGFVVALHTPAPADAPENPFRGGPLAGRTELMQRRLATVGHLLPAGTGELWERLRQAPVWDAAPTWLHGDLHPANLLVRDGRLTAVIDFGDVTAGDPANDLAIAWMLFDGPARGRFFAAAGTDPATVQRSAAWAISLACAYLTSAGDNPTMAGIAQRTLQQVHGELG